MRAVAIAHPNIALSKYWGKRPGDGNQPAVPSLSLTLAGLATTTEVGFDEALAEDELELDGERALGRARERVSRLLDLVCGPARLRARVRSHNDFPTAAGLASSASAFAALAVAADAAAGTRHGAATLSDFARRVSASAGRSLFGGFVELPAGREGATVLAAEPLCPVDHWQLRLVVAVTEEGPKAIGSTEGMNLTAATSPLYAGWLEAAPRLHERVRAAVLARDFAALAQAAEQSALTMHASAIAADPGILYWSPGTVAVMREVRMLRARGTAAFFTIDAGPHVKVFTTVEDAAAVERAVAALPTVRRTLQARPGEGARVMP